MAEVRDVKTGAHYQVGQAGALEALEGKLFIGATMGFTGMEVSLNRVPRDQASPFMHAHHRHEELYLFLHGQGEFQVDRDVFPVEPGTMVRVAPDGHRAWRNTGDGELVFVVVQANVDSLTPQDGIRFDEAPAWKS